MFILDIVFKKEGVIKKELKENANFTMNASALLVKDMFNGDWKNKVISLPEAIEDIRNKRLRLNPYRRKLHGSELFAVLRFVSQGFIPPPPEDIKSVCEALKSFPKDRFEINVQKVFRYVGGECKARRLMKKLSITEDIFSYEAIQKSEKMLLI